MFTVLSEEAEEDVQAIIFEAGEADAEAGSNNQLVGDLYASYMNEAAISEAGTAPLQPYLAEINAVESLDDATALFASSRCFYRRIQCQ